MKNNKPLHMDTNTILLLILVGLFAGTMSGLVGIGGGVVIVPCLVLLLGFSQHTAQGTSLALLLLPVGVLAVLNYYRTGNVDFKAVGIMCLAFVIGGWIGSKIALSLQQDVVKKIFAIVLFYTAFKMMGWDNLLIRWIKGLFS
jgi:uncharacterized protein